VSQPTDDCTFLSARVKELGEALLRADARYLALKASLPQAEPPTHVDRYHETPCWLCNKAVPVGGPFTNRCWPSCETTEPPTDLRMLIEKMGALYDKWKGQQAYRIREVGIHDAGAAGIQSCAIDLALLKHELEAAVRGAARPQTLDHPFLLSTQGEWCKTCGLIERLHVAALPSSSTTKDSK